MLTINLKDGNRRLGATPGNLSTPLHLIDSIEISGHELQEVALAPLITLPFSSRTLEDMPAWNHTKQINRPSSIQLILDILRGEENHVVWCPPVNQALSNLDQALERSRVAMTALKQTRDALLTMQPSTAQERILEACRKLGAKGYSIERILGILDADGRPELDTATGKTANEVFHEIAEKQSGIRVED